MHLDIEDVRETVQKIIDLFNQKGSAEYVGEDVSVYKHMVICAYLALSKGYNNEIVISALLHDLGHLLESEEQMNGFGNVNHELLGAQFLKAHGFSKLVIDAVSYHVAAKRYLCAVDKYYYELLSTASKETLKMQGGKMNLIETQFFENLPHYKEILLVRKMDDLAKDAEMEFQPIEFYSTMLEEHLFNKLR